MYDFIDVGETAENNFLPSEALRINGEYIENLIPGYRTLNVSGREALSPEIETYETGIRDGSKLKSRRYPARTITVKYQLIAESNEAFRAAYNKLGGLLDVQNAELVFNDEQDKFFIGTPSGLGEIEPGSNAVVGEIAFQCNDPFKYSVDEFEVEPSPNEQSVLFEYNGTYKAYPKLEAEFYNESEVSEDGESSSALTGAGDCGYIAFFNEDEKIIQLGNPDETDTGTYAKAQTLVNQEFKNEAAWGKAASVLWSANNGILNYAGIVQTGSVAMGAGSYTGGVTDTSGTLLKVRTKEGSPLIDYEVTAKTSERTANSIKVDVSIKSVLTTSVSGIGTQRGIKASLYIGNAWHDVTIKNTSAHWYKGKSYITNMSVTITGLTADTTILNGIKFKAERTDNLGSAGKLAETNCNDLTISAYIEPTPSSYFLTPSSYGTASGWHGPSITRTIPTDAAGDAGAENFCLTVVHKTHMGNSKTANSEMGQFHIQIVTADGQKLAGVVLCKNQVGTNGYAEFYVNERLIYLDTYKDISYNSGLFGSSSTYKTSSIIKDGGTVTFNVCGLKKSFTDATIKNAQAAKITFAFLRHSDYEPLSFNGLHSVKFVKNNCETWRDVPNKFSANDVVTADCGNGIITLNGNSAPDLGALGNDWEGFYLKPGVNQIGYSYSDWVPAGYGPKIKVRYREAFL